ncbi:uroporphyrinogen decarboxylase family protein [Parasporobacterium paucivorans]|uniref:Uroporphyrinogen decarboxylase (URO-D) n=1 Tax=Parasporobacterium paucivorans DSM 15970 TaxID=1122934 RepID=A0A1M6KKE6_9FIRM|nr:uroporphyrinogen decarboxylase family protein [Parasporobacterium paucivorans]SHJ59434.1 Uroporphyrinogen decarboxylase (URO-D) [Parasporobacterium paucivorans DSM 15970]
MLTPKENLLELLKGKDGHPDRLVNMYEPFKMIMNDACNQFARGNRKRGVTTIDKWGTTIMFPEDAPGPMPHVTHENKVCPDITEWRKYITVPDIAAGTQGLWEASLESAAQVDRSQHMVMGFMGTGIFEQCHYLLGFEDTLVNLLMEPDDMHDLVDAIAEYRFTWTKLLVDNLKPDAIISLDDWGTKTSLFMQPDIWRSYFKDHYKRIYSYMHEHGVIVLHHSDSFCEPIVEDMVDIGIDIWQGVLPTNNIPKLQEQLQGRMVLMGGIDSGTDRVDATEEQIRREARRACDTYGKGGSFIPSITYGGPDSLFPHVAPILTDEINRYNKEHYGVGN